MLSTGLTNAPLTKLLLIYTLTTSTLLSILDAKHLAAIHVSPHLGTYHQFWRCLIWQFAGYSNSTEALFAAICIYHCRVVERAWGARKMATFVAGVALYSTLLTPLVLVLVLRPLSAGYLNYLPSGLTAVVFALLAQYYAGIPHVFRYNVSTSTSTSASTSEVASASPAPDKSLTLLLSDKSITYLVASQLAFSQFPATILPAAVGWFVGLAWRAEVLPGAGRFRVPAWVVGEREVPRLRRGSAGERRYDDFRRRLEGEVAAASGSSGAGPGAEGRGDDAVQGQRQRRNAGFMDRLRGAF